MIIILIWYIMVRVHNTPHATHQKHAHTRAFVVVVWLVSRLIGWSRVIRLSLDRHARARILYTQSHHLIVIVVGALALSKLFNYH